MTGPQVEKLEPRLLLSAFGPEATAPLAAPPGPTGAVVAMEDGFEASPDLSGVVLEFHATRARPGGRVRFYWDQVLLGEVDADADGAAVLVVGASIWPQGVEGRIVAVETTDPDAPAPVEDEANALAIVVAAGSACVTDGETQSLGGGEDSTGGVMFGESFEVASSGAADEPNRTLDAVEKTPVADAAPAADEPAPAMTAASTAAAAVERTSLPSVISPIASERPAVGSGGVFQVTLPVSVVVRRRLPAAPLEAGEAPAACEPSAAPAVILLRAAATGAKTPDDGGPAEVDILAAAPVASASAPQSKLPAAVETPAASKPHLASAGVAPAADEAEETDLAEAVTLLMAMHGLRRWPGV